MEARARDARECVEHFSTSTPDKPWLAVAAVALHSWYTALETILERIVRELDQNVPRGDSSHRDLLSQAMTEIPGVRPAVLPEELTADLLALLSFRHFFRHAYAVELDAKKVQLELERMLGVVATADAALAAFDDVLARAEESLREGS